MDKSTRNPNDITAEADARLPQPTSSYVSAVVNGVGNGATAGMAAFALPRAWAELTHKPIKQPNARAIAIATGIGTTLGLWYGMHEAKQLADYRDNIGEEIITLRDRVRQLEGKQPLTQAQKLAARRAHDVAESSELSV